MQLINMIKRFYWDIRNCGDLEQPNIDNDLNYKQSINLYYKKQFHNNYKRNEQILKYLNQKNVLPTDPIKKLDLSYTTTNLKPLN